MDTNSKRKLLIKGHQTFYIYWVFMNDFYLGFFKDFCHPLRQIVNWRSKLFNLKNKTIPVPNMSPVCLILSENFGALL